MPYKLFPPGWRGPCWYVRGTDSGGEFEASTGKDTERDAKRWVEEIYLPDRARRRAPGAGQPVAFRVAAKHYKAAHPDLSDDDARLVDALADEIGDKDCRFVVRATLVAAADALYPGAANGTKNRKVMAPGAAILHYAAEQEWCEYRRIRKFWESRKSNREPASDATLARLFAHIEDPLEEMAPQWEGVDPNLAHKRLLLAMLYEFGLRITDYLNIEWTHIDLPSGKLSVRIGKTDDWAMLELSKVVVAMLANLPTKGGFLFPWRTRRGVYAWLNRVRRRAGVHYTPHLSRHALATAAGVRRIPDAEAAKLGVWRDPRSLHRYQHVMPEPIPGRDAGLLMASPEPGRKRGQRRKTA